MFLIYLLVSYVISFIYLGYKAASNDFEEYHVAFAIFAPIALPFVALFMIGFKLHEHKHKIKNIIK